MFKKLLTDALIKVLRMLGRKKADYPKRLYHKTRADFIEKVKKHGKK